VTTATSQPPLAASASRAESSALWTPVGGVQARSPCGELRDAIRHPEAPAAGDDPVAQGDVAQDARRREIALRPLEDVARKLLVRGHPLGIRVGEAVGHDVDPGFEFVVAARPDLDPWQRHSVGLAVERKAEHVLKRREPVAPLRQERANLGVGEVRELDLHGSAAKRCRPARFHRGLPRSAHRRNRAPRAC